ncbi:hypothetical protein BDV93DRAFT_95111 [Ceratobasidium sp. AG-I]|nr:hypothetical protein BDV93DRAFT_95111 [Ceratobasidium sp. AG-I]
MSEPTSESKVPDEPPEQETQLVQKNVASKPPRRVLRLPPFPPLTYTTQFAGMSASPSSSRRRAALTPSQVQHHASGSFFAPIPHGHEEWIFRGTETIPEGSNSGSNTSSDPLTTDSVTTPSSSAIECVATRSSPPIHPAPAVAGPIYARPRAYSHTPLTTTSDSAGVYYSTAHRRVPSSPSFRSASLLSTGYFDRPPSPTSSVCSHSSEPIHTSLSLSELLAGGPRIFLGEYEPDEEEHARREKMREERRLAMVERHAAILERREQKRAQNSSGLHVGGWIESSAKRYHEW